MNIHHEEKIRASIDIGSNSVLLLIGYWKGDQFICLDQDAHITGLGRGIREQQAFDHLSQQETMNVLMLYKEKILKHNLKVDEVIVVATEASRVAKNADLFFHQVKLNTGFTVYTISSEGESYYSALGVSLGLSSFLKSSQKNLPSDIFLIDLGGGSTEFSLFSRQPFAHKYQISFPFGCVRFDHQTSYKEISLAVEKEFKKLETLSWWKELKDKNDFLPIAIAGTWTSIGAVIQNLMVYEDDKVHGKAISKEQLYHLYRDFELKTPEEIQKKFSFLGKRSVTIRVGVALFWNIFEFANLEFLWTSVYGARYALTKEYKIPSNFVVKKNE